jgi:ATP-dependent Lon protease
VQQAVEEEIQKLKVLETASSEYNVTRNYLDWLTSMPYGVFNEEKFDIDFAQKCLDADHYGMQDVKDRILEFIAVGKLNDAVQVCSLDLLTTYLHHHALSVSHSSLSAYS